MKKQDTPWRSLSLCVSLALSLSLSQPSNFFFVLFFETSPSLHVQIWISVCLLRLETCSLEALLSVNCFIQTNVWTLINPWFPHVCLCGFHCDLVWRSGEERGGEGWGSWGWRACVWLQAQWTSTFLCETLTLNHQLKGRDLSLTTGRFSFKSLFFSHSLYFPASL